ncbi:helix-turn-helix domain-containing protein [Lysinibacillus sp. 54212]|uniref:helix-turn-helix domain-containing protein n=1 Tax=Lysinibacillus sp. 54212 TaxID=3119829 RepID=UPI002FC82FC5
MIGRTIKKIRISKGYTQKFISENIIHQTSYSKFELDKIQLTTENFIHILRKLDISYAEFSFIHNDYDLDEKEKIIQTFINLRFIDEKVLQEIINLSTAYLNKSYDSFLYDILQLCKGFIKLKMTSDFKIASKYAKIIWSRLERTDIWYLSDLYLINNILFLFPLETSISIADLAITRLEKYSKLDNRYKLLALTIQYNVVHLLIRANEYNSAYIMNEKVIYGFKENKNYFQTSLSLLRKGFLENKLGKQPDHTTSMLLINLIGVAEIFDDRDLVERLKEEEKYLRRLEKVK